MCGSAEGRLSNITFHVAADEVRHAGRRSAVREVNHVGSRHCLEKFASEMSRRAVAARRHVELSRPRLRVGDELRHEFTGSFGLMTIDIRHAATSVIGTKSFTGSKGILLPLCAYSAWLIACVPTVPISSV